MVKCKKWNWLPAWTDAKIQKLNFKIVLLGQVMTKCFIHSCSMGEKLKTGNFFPKKCLCIENCFNKVVKTIFLNIFSPLKFLPLVEINPCPKVSNWIAYLVSVLV